jgi:antitoxin (DNA-binding transcriptional repressor) of toxin-antitoxin stability system
MLSIDFLKAGVTYTTKGRMDMKLISLAEVKANFQSIMSDVVSGNEFTITQDGNNEMFAVIIPYENWQKTKIRRLGALRDKGSVIFEKDFSMTDEELISHEISC